MRTDAAVLTELGHPLELVELEIPALRPGQVLVELAYSGVCHTQLLEARGRRGDDRFLPHCMGHEGSGRVVDAGPGVTKVTVGNPVVLSWMKGSGADVPGSVYGSSRGAVNAGAVTTFGRHAVVSENRLTAMAEGLAFPDAALLGCAVPTGLGAVFNVAQPAPGQGVAVLGTGGIGLCAVAGAAIAGCWPVIAVDLVAEKLEVARQMGATHVVDASRTVWIEEVERLCPQGLDFAIEATGQPEMMADALTAVRNQGGVAVVVGNARHGSVVSLNPQQFNLGKRMLGTWGGDNDPDRDFPRYARLLLGGRLTLAPLHSRTYPLEQINDALDDLEAGRVVRPLVDLAPR